MRSRGWGRGDCAVQWTHDPDDARPRRLCGLDDHEGEGLREEPRKEKGVRPTQMAKRSFPMHFIV
jgi:hypothetical protein